MTKTIDSLASFLDTKDVRRERVLKRIGQACLVVVFMVLMLATTIVQAKTEAPSIIGKTFDGKYPIYDLTGFYDDNKYYSFDNEWAWDAEWLRDNLPKVSEQYIEENPFDVHCSGYVCQDRYGSVIGASPSVYGSPPIKRMYE